eukprot:2709078-Karenia_brevis.AAC.1
MCEDSPRTVYDATTASSLGASQGVQQSTWRPNINLTPPPPPPPPAHATKMCNPQDQSQMHNEMGWEATDDVTEEDMTQSAMFLYPKNHLARQWLNM